MTDALAIDATIRGSGVARARRPSPTERLEFFAGWLLSAVATAMMWLVLIGPCIAVLLIAFTDWEFGMPSVSFVGVENFKIMFADRVFWTSLRNTVIYVGLLVPISVALGLGVALLIEAGARGRGFYSAVYFLPVTATLLATALAWEFAFHPTVGWFNLILSSFGLPMLDWMKNADVALHSLVIIGVWQAVGLNMVLYLAGLRAIPRDLYEAASIDGADSAWERFRRVTWPMLGAANVFVVTITLIRSFQVFDTVQVLTDGGPNKATSVLVYLMYQEGFQFLRSGYAAAITVAFLALTLAITWAQSAVLDKRAHYA
jgi:multiple sugar transport system permease protein